MILPASRRLRHRAFVATTALGLTLSAVAAAQAFTFQDREGAANGGRGFKDLDIPKVPKDEPTARFNSDGQTVIKQGNSTFYFGARRPSNEQFDTNKLFDPFYRDGR